MASSKTASDLRTGTNDGSGSALASFLLGLPAVKQRQAGIPQMQLRAWSTDGFLQDSFRSENRHKRRQRIRPRQFLARSARREAAPGRHSANAASRVVDRWLPPRQLQI